MLIKRFTTQQYPVFGHSRSELKFKMHYFATRDMFPNI